MRLLLALALCLRDAWRARRRKKPNLRSADGCPCPACSRGAR